MGLFRTLRVDFDLCHRHDEGASLLKAYLKPLLREIRVLIKLLFICDVIVKSVIEPACLVVECAHLVHSGSSPRDGCLRQEIYRVVDSV